MQWNQRIKLEKTEGVFIPGFNGLAAPYWKNGFEDIRINLSERPNEIIRAAMESIGFLVNDILNCIIKAGLDLPETLTASGGGAKSSLLQFTANITGKTISHSLVKDKTAFGIYKILDGNNLDEIYSSINKLLERNKFIEFGKNAKENSKNFYWNKIIKKYLEII